MSALALKRNGIAGSGQDRTAAAGTVPRHEVTPAGTVGLCGLPGDRPFVLADATDPVAGAGRFHGLPGGVTVARKDHTAQVGDSGDLSSRSLTGGNDVALHNLQPVPEPAAGLDGTTAARRPEPMATTDVGCERRASTSGGYRPRWLGRV